MRNEVTIIKEFVEKIHPIYVMLDWKWWDKGVPTEEDLIKELNYLVDEVKNGSTDIRTGGLFAIRDEDGIGQIKIGFEIEELLPLNLK